MPCRVSLSGWISSQAGRGARSTWILAFLGRRGRAPAAAAAAAAPASAALRARSLARALRSSLLARISFWIWASVGLSWASSPSPPLRSASSGSTWQKGATPSSSRPTRCQAISGAEKVRTPRLRSMPAASASLLLISAVPRVQPMTAPQRAR